ncbi:hypothetical protein B9D04_10675 [Weissella cibaria]|uniref:Uncharacterized protein n=2 Tax=Weissella cibaria TaxID=137591 RepID=A0A1X4JIP6_9LACO|nr:hypothetical protein B9D04_10675 [Weissella cibaria]
MGTRFMGQMDFWEPVFHYLVATLKHMRVKNLVAGTYNSTCYAYCEHNQQKVLYVHCWEPLSGSDRDALYSSKRIREKELRTVSIIQQLIEVDRVVFIHDGYFENHDSIPKLSFKGQEWARQVKGLEFWSLKDVINTIEYMYKRDIKLAEKLDVLRERCIKYKKCVGTDDHHSWTGSWMRVPNIVNNNHWKQIFLKTVGDFHVKSF